MRINPIRGFPLTNIRFGGGGSVAQEDGNSVLCNDYMFYALVASFAQSFAVGLIELYAMFRT